MTDALFDMEPEPRQDAPTLGVDARRTQRSLALLEAGRHPVSKLPLRDDAPPVTDRGAPGPRCGTCAQLVRHSYHLRTYLKCGQNITGGPATDLRAWWPGCAAWTPADTRPAGGDA